MDAEKNNDEYLSLEIRKSEGKTDEYGNYIFEVEASNENLDLQNQIVLQNALMESKDDFLKGGVISYDHLHKRKNSKGEIISDPSMVIVLSDDDEVDTNGADYEDEDGEEDEDAGTEVLKSLDYELSDMRKTNMISSDMQKCMDTGKPMNPEYYEFLQKEFSKEAK